MLYNKRKYRKFEITPEFIKAIKEAFFGTSGVSWDIPEKEWSRLMALNEKYRKEDEEKEKLKNIS